MQSEQTVVGIPFLRKLAMLAQQIGCPCRLAVVVAVTVGAVVHDFAVAQLITFVYLPEDDAAVATGT